MGTVEKRRNFIINIIYFAIVLGLFYLFLKYAFGLFLPFIAAMFIAVILQKPVNFLTKKCNGKGRGIFSTLLAIFCFVIVGSIVAGVLAKVIIEIKEFFVYFMHKLENIPLFTAQINEWINTKLTMLPETLRDTASSYIGEILSKFDSGSVQNTAVAVEAKPSLNLSWLASPLSMVWGTAKQIPMIAVGMLVSVVSCCFMTADYASLTKLITKLVGEEHTVKLVATKRILFSTLGKMGKAYSIIILITFTEMAIGLYVLSLVGVYRDGYVLTIALLTAIVDILPVLGTGTILIPWAVWSLVTGKIGLGIGLLVIYAIITIVRQYTEPKLVASQLGLPAFVTIMAMYIGTQLFGFVGLFVLPISIMLVKVLNDEGVIHIFRSKKVDPEKLDEEVEQEVEKKTREIQELEND